jgi:alcohol dehydrogenase (NADP+)
LHQPALLAECAAAASHFTAYAPLGSRDRPAGLKNDHESVLLDNPVIGASAAAHGGSSA